MVDAYKCTCGNKFDVEREGDRAADSAKCSECGKQAKRRFLIQIRRPRRSGNRAAPTMPPPAPRPPAQPDRPKRSVMGMSGKSRGNRVFLWGDETVDAGLHLKPGADAQVDELYVEGAKIDIYNEGRLDAPDGQIE